MNEFNPVKGDFTSDQLPHKLIKKKKEDRFKDENPVDRKGWWSCSNLSGSLQGVTNAIMGNEDIPRWWRDALVQELGAQCGKEFNFVYLDAHCTIDGGRCLVHMAIKAEKKLL